MKRLTSPVGVGLVGFGKAGRIFHAPLIDSVDGIELRAIVQRRGDDARERYPNASILRDLDALLGDDAIDVVVVATPNPLHFEQAHRALLAGKHVVVDKPFTVDSEEAGRLIEIAGEHDRLLTVFQNRRLEGDFLTLRRLLDEGTLGRIIAYEARFERFRDEPRPDAWRERDDPGSGILYDLGAHLIDQALVLFGMPQTITADVRTERDFGGSDDAFDVWMHYPRMKVTLSAGMLVRHPGPRYLARGTRGEFVKYGLDPQEAELAAGRTPRDRDWGRDPAGQWGRLLTSEGERTIETLPGRYQAFYENLRDVLTRSAEPMVAAEDARATIRLIERAIESSRERRTLAV